MILWGGEREDAIFSFPFKTYFFNKGFFENNEKRGDTCDEKSQISPLKRQGKGSLLLPCRTPFFRHRRRSRSKPTPSSVGRERANHTVAKEKADATHLLFLLCCTAQIDATEKKSIKSRALEFWRQFHVHP